jgi:hypothetical protein
MVDGLLWIVDLAATWIERISPQRTVDEIENSLYFIEYDPQYPPHRPGRFHVFSSSPGSINL